MSKRDSDDVRRASQIGAVQRSQETAGCTHVCRNAADVIVEHIAHQETRNACVKPPVPASPPGRSSRAGAGSALSRPGHHVSVVDRRRVRDQRQPPRHQHRPGAVHTARRLRAWQQPVKHAAHVARALRHRGNVLLTTPWRCTPTRPPHCRLCVHGPVDAHSHESTPGSRVPVKIVGRCVDDQPSSRRRSTGARRLRALRRSGTISRV